MKAFITFLLISVQLSVTAQWNGNSALNNAICDFTGSQTNVQVVSDGAGGAILTWEDTRNSDKDIYAQHINAAGSLQWNADGIVICNAVSDQYFPRLVTDAAGGAIICWYDNRAGNYDIYAQRINASGIVQWATDGVPVTTQPGNQNAHQLMADGSGGAIIVWSDGAGGGPNADINAQRINAAGTALWTTSVCNANSLQNIPQLVSDGAGGAIISWEDWRNFSQPDIYAQRISSNGFSNWGYNGIPICTEPNFANQYNTKIVSDDAGGAIICWLDNRNFSSGLDIYAQKVNSSGVVQWTGNGVVVCNAPALQTSEQMLADGAGGAIIAWEDRRAERDVYAQRLNTTGMAQWPANGMSISNVAGTQTEPQLVTRSSGGAIITWTDFRNNSQGDIYAQAISLSGLELWAVNGAPVANDPNSQSVPQLISDGSDAAIIAWQDLRGINPYDIYSSKLFSDGALPVKLISFSASLQHPNALLQWQVANEENVAAYHIERSVTGNNFNRIGTVYSNGNSTATRSYHYSDYTISELEAGKIFYRLQIEDTDGKIAYSNIAALAISPDFFVSIAPNPVIDHIIISSRENIRSVAVINPAGQILRSVSCTGIMNQQKLDLQDLPAGYYLIRVTGENQQWTKQFIKK